MLTDEERQTYIRLKKVYEEEHNGQRGTNQHHGVPDYNTDRRQEHKVWQEETSSRTNGDQEKSVARRKSVRSTFDLTRIGTAIVAMGIGIGVWVIGARYTCDGIIWLINWLLAFVAAPTINGPLSWQVYLIMSPIPIIFSLIEFGEGSRFIKSVWGVRVTTIIVGLTDVVTTFFGLLAMPVQSSPAAEWFVATKPLVTIVAIILTVGPEWMMKWGWKTIRHRGL